jgi:hypothetical protein
MYDGEYRARQTSDFRGGTQGARQTSQPVFAARKERGNPFGDSSEARPQPTDQDTQNYTTFPNQMKVEKVTKETFLIEKVKMKLASINAKFYKAFEKRSVGSDQDAADLFVLMSSVPDMWQEKLSVIDNGHEGMHWAMDPFDGGINQFQVQELEDEFRDLIMLPKDIYESYEMRADSIVINLHSNERAVTHAALVEKIVNGLPEYFI